LAGICKRLDKCIEGTSYKLAPARVNIGTAVLTKNPAVGIVVGIADITGLSDFVYSKF
jgi:hypothetical protein